MTADPRLALLLGALLAALGVTLGAFGAHGLKAVLDPERLGWWNTAVQYQLWHAVGLVAIGAAALPGTRGVAVLLGVGVLLFSGSLYVMALTGQRWLGMVTPLGGLAMIAGWLLLAWRVWRA
jgi:uncharacterized membrane protein YgdD (TMEM256/DUF423 family)